MYEFVYRINAPVRNREFNSLLSVEHQSLELQVQLDGNGGFAESSAKMVCCVSSNTQKEVLKGSTPAGFQINEVASRS